MADGSAIGPVLVLAGIALVVLGLLVWAGGLGWFGNLPGDFRFEGERTRVYLPLASMLVLSVVLSLVLWIARRLF